MNRALPLQIAVLTLIAASTAPDARAERQTFLNPSFQGYRLDYCKASGRECGERIATAWCVVQGYEYASVWEIDRDIGERERTIHLDSRYACERDRCDGFASIACGREESALSMLNWGWAARSTIFTPDRQEAVTAVALPEVQTVAPGCSQLEPGVLLCQSAPDYEHCRTLLEAGYVLGCRAALGLDGAVTGLRQAASGSYELSLRARASVTVERGSRGDGRISGETRYRVTFEIPERADLAETCLQRDRYEYHQTGPLGGWSEIHEADDCDEPVVGRYSPHEDDLQYAYGLCEGSRAWGTRIEATTDLVVAGVFHFTQATASSGAGHAGASRSVAPYLAIRAPLDVVCRE